MNLEKPMSKAKSLELRNFLNKHRNVKTIFGRGRATSWAKRATASGANVDLVINTKDRLLNYKYNPLEVDYVAPDAGLPVLMVMQRVSNMLIKGQRVERSILDKVIK